MARPALFRPLIEDCLRDGPKTVGEVVGAVGCTRQMAHKVLVEVGIGYGPPNERTYRLPQPGERAGVMAPVGMSMRAKSLEGKTGPRAAVIDALNRHGGIIEDPQSGWATRMLFDAVKDDDRITRSTPGHLSNLLNAMEKDGLVTRLINGRRTFAIELAPHLRVEPEPERHLEVVPDPEPEPDPIDTLKAAGKMVEAVELLAPDTAWDELAEAQGVDASALELPEDRHGLGELAMALLHAVGSILHHGDGEQAVDADALKVRLGAALSHAQTMEKKYREAKETIEEQGAEIRILKQQRDTREAKVRQLESNMAAAIKAVEQAGGTADGKNAESFRAIHKFMVERERPKSR